MSDFRLLLCIHEQGICPFSNTLCSSCQRTRWVWVPEPVRVLLCGMIGLQSQGKPPPKAALVLFPACALSWHFSETAVSQFREKKKSQINSFFGREAFLSDSGSLGLCSGMLSRAGVTCHCFQLLVARGHILLLIWSPAPPLLSKQQGLTRDHFLVGFSSSGFSRDGTPGPCGRCEVVVTAGGKGQRPVMVSVGQLPPTSVRWQLGARLTSAGQRLRLRLAVSVTHTMFKAPLHIGSSLIMGLFPVSADLTRVCIVKCKCHTHKYNNICFKVKRVGKWVLCLK